jgi:transposase
MAQLDVITGPERRRRWSDEEKRAVVAAAFAPGAIVTQVARRADVCASQLYRWRRELRQGSNGFTELIVMADGAAPEARSMAAVEIDFTGVAHVRIPASIPAELAAAIVTALSRRRVCRSPGEGR